MAGCYGFVSEASGEFLLMDDYPFLCGQYAAGHPSSTACTALFPAFAFASSSLLFTTAASAPPQVLAALISHDLP